ncbi:MAG: 3-keto-5-aminohexanoate cleavage protein [Rhodobacteraceae bacterium]|nr:3-keto-5-aminohexanoate cleavage protein [Paracoccaceae bacterium]
MKPMVIAAPNGARRGKADHVNLPVRIEEIAAEAALCQKAGAAVLHLHVRDTNGAHSLDAGLYRAATMAIDEAAPGMLVQITSEAAGVFDLPAQIACVEAVRPKAVSVAWREFSPEENAEARRFYAWALGEGIHVQHILYSIEDIARFKAFGLKDQSVLLVLGKYAGVEARTDELPAYLDALGDVHDWCVCAFGKAEHAVVSAAIAAGGHARVGFENNLWRRDGTLAAGTHALVAQIENDVMSADEVRAYWRI